MNLVFIFIIITAVWTIKGMHALLPVFVLVLQGATVHFSCRNESKIWWECYRPASPTHLEVIHNGDELIPRFTERFNVTYSPTEKLSRLSISEVRLSDAGEYWCVNTISGVTLMETSLIVIAQVPQCLTMSNAATDRLEVDCKVCYAGLYLKPNITCYNSERQVTPRNTTTTRQQLNESDCSVHTQFHTVNKDIQGSVFTCSVIFAERQEVLYNYTWTSQLANITYGPAATELTVEHNRTILRHGDKLTCSADSNPQPELYWIIANTTVYHGAIYHINVCNALAGDVMFEPSVLRSIELSCVATNGERQATGRLNLTLDISTEEAQHCSFSTRKISTKALVITIVLVLIIVFASVTAAVTAFILHRRRTAINRITVEERVEIEGINVEEETRPESEPYTVDVAVTEAARSRTPYENIPFNSPTPLCPVYQNFPLREGPYELLSLETVEPPRPTPVYTSLKRPRRLMRATEN